MGKKKKAITAKDIGAFPTANLITDEKDKAVKTNTRTTKSPRTPKGTPGSTKKKKTIGAVHMESFPTTNPITEGAETIGERNTRPSKSPRTPKQGTPGSKKKKITATKESFPTTILITEEERNVKSPSPKRTPGSKTKKVKAESFPTTNFIT